MVCFSVKAQRNFDLVVVGGTPSGISTAVSAAKMGKTVLILERTSHIGGLPANGLGATDIATRGATTGFFKEFVDSIYNYYLDKYGEKSAQLEKCSGGYHFEPSVAEIILTRMLERQPNIKVLKMRQFDSDPKNLIIVNDRIQEIVVLNRTTQQMEAYEGRVFIDATYEGDLAAAAGIPYRVGRESKSEFNEQGAGNIYKYWDGAEGQGSTGLGDNAVQAYNYRLCLTNVASNRCPIIKPLDYNRKEYVSLIDDVLTGRHASFQMNQVSNEMMEANRKKVLNGKISEIPGDKWGIGKITNMVDLPNGKTDANNQHQALISTDLPEENWHWPTASWEWRDKFAIRLKNYSLGLLWFAQNDLELPELFKKETKEWGFAKDEYADNFNFPRQVYVREGRRMEGVYLFTANDALPVNDGSRPPIHTNSVTASHYALDSHAVLKREKGRINLNGFLSYESVVYTVPYGVMVPKTIDNLLFPVSVSATHIGFSTLRMEPCWMALGQAAGIAASIAINNGLKVKNVPVTAIQSVLLDQNVTLIYYKDCAVGTQDFRLVQFMGMRGYLPDLNARLHDTVDLQTFENWKKKFGNTIDCNIGKTTRKELLQDIYNKLIAKYHY
ncbi:MAG: FAD-dependent oxidoreductase [Bacteroidia bacterium]|nr:FAD-dependent oxidoreductase [Bacteroidia bacterium]